MSKQIAEALMDVIGAAVLAGHNRERLKVLNIVSEISCSNEIGEYVYVRDLLEYLKSADLEEKEKRTNKW